MNGTAYFDPEAIWGNFKMNLGVFCGNSVRYLKQLALVSVCGASLVMPQLATAQTFDIKAGISVGESLWPCFSSHYYFKETTLSAHAIGSYAAHIVEDDLSVVPVAKYAQSCQESYDLVNDLIVNGKFPPSDQTLFYFAAHTELAEELATALSDTALAGGKPFYAVASLGVSEIFLDAMEFCREFVPEVVDLLTCTPETMKPVVSRLTDQMEDALAQLVEQDKDSGIIPVYQAMIASNRAAIAD